LSLGEMQVDKAPFLVHVLECNNPAVLVRHSKPNQPLGRMW
jgi:hypothetical protein